MPQAHSTSSSSTSESDSGESIPRAGRNEWLLVFFTAMTNMADAIARVALPLLAAKMTQSPSLISAVGVLITLPWLLAALPVGVLVDRVSRRTLMVVAEAIRLCAITSLFASVLLDAKSLPVVYVVALAMGMAEVLALTSGASIVPAAVPKSRWEPATARITAMEYLWKQFLGAPVGGFLVASGFVLAFGVSGLVYAVGMVLLTLLVGDFSPKPAGGAQARPRQPIRVEIREGLDFLWKNRLLRTMALLIAVMAGCWSVWLALIPAYAAAPGPLGLSPRQYGLLLTCLGVGGIVGTLLVGRVNRLLGRRWSMFVDIIGSFFLVAAPAVLPSVKGSAVPIACAAFVAGVGGTMWTVNARVIMQTFVPDHLLGRFNAAYRLISWGTAPIAAAVGGLVAQFVNYHVAFGVFAVLCALLVIPYLRVVTDKALAAVDTPRSDTASAEG